MRSREFVFGHVHNHAKANGPKIGTKRRTMYTVFQQADWSDRITLGVRPKETSSETATAISSQISKELPQNRETRVSFGSGAVRIADIR